MKNPSLGDIDTAPTRIDPSDSDVTITNDTYEKTLAEVGYASDMMSAKTQEETHRLLNSLIRPMAMKVFRFMWAYCAGVFALLILQGFGICDFNLPDESIQVLVGSTAVTVIGLVGMVLTGVFIGARKNK